MDLNSENFSVSPEQQAKFYSQSGPQIKLPGRFTNKKFVALGVLAALVLITTFLFIMVRRGGSTILSPIADRMSDLGKSFEPTIMNPLNGMMVKEADAALWKDERPFAVMIIPMPVPSQVWKKLTWSMR